MPQRSTAPADPPGRYTTPVRRLHAMVTALHLRSPLRRLRRLPERLLHPLRRRRTMEGLRGTPIPATVVFVCQGNIYRSPYAAHVFEAHLPDGLRDRVQVNSGGFVGPDRPSPENALQLAAQRGHDMSRHRSSLLSLERLGGEELVVVMDAGQQRAICERYGKQSDRVVILGDLDPHPVETRTIRDPWGQPDDVLASSYDRIERCVDNLIEALFRR